MEILATALPGCFELCALVIGDARGSFIKTFLFDRYESVGLRTDWREEYHSTSARGVVRGMHLQAPPHEHAKVVFCVAGEVTDVVLDVRRGSPTYQQHSSFTLSALNGKGLYIPSGCAHGFTSRSATATMTYKVTSPHAPTHDVGIAFDSFGFDWSVDEPILSARDRGHPTLGAFDSSFIFDRERPSR